MKLFLATEAQMQANGPVTPGNMGRLCYPTQHPGTPIAIGAGIPRKRGQKTVTVQNFNCGQKSVSVCKHHYEFVLGAGAKAKTMTTCPAQRETTYP